MPPPITGLLRPVDVAARLGISRQRVHQLMRKEKLVPTGPDGYFVLDDVDRYHPSTSAQRVAARQAAGHVSVVEAAQQARVSRATALREKARGYLRASGPDGTLTQEDVDAWINGRNAELTRMRRLYQTYLQKQQRSNPRSQKEATLDG